MLESQVRFYLVFLFVWVLVLLTKKSVLMENHILMTGVKLDELLERIGQLIDSKLGKGFQPPPDENQSKYVSRTEVAKLLKITS